MCHGPQVLEALDEDAAVPGKVSAESSRRLRYDKPRVQPISCQLVGNSYPATRVVFQVPKAEFSQDSRSYERKTVGSAGPRQYLFVGVVQFSLFIPHAMGPMNGIEHPSAALLPPRFEHLDLLHLVL